VTNIHIYQKNIFLCVAYGQYPNMFWTFLKKILENVFSHGFLKHNKNYLLAFLDFYNMFVKLQKVLANIPKYTKNLFWGEFIYYSPLMFG
jgi:hypothetical protein